MSDEDKLPWLLATKAGAFAQAIETTRNSDKSADRASSAKQNEFRVRNTDDLHETLKRWLANRTWLLVLILFAAALSVKMFSD